MTHADDGNSYREAADELVKVGARLLVRWSEITSAPPPAPETLGAEIAERLRDTALQIERLVATDSAPAVAIEIHTYAVHCAWLAADLHRAAVAIDPAAVIEALTAPERRDART